MKQNYLNGKDFYNIFRHGAMEVINNKEHLNNINVFPVADGDTGNNLAMTLTSVIDYTQVVDSFYETSKSMAEASIYGARGNSGVIFAQYISGIAEASEGKDRISIKDFIEAIRKASEGIYDSLVHPVEGTMLTVMKQWSVYLSNHKDKYQYIDDMFLNSIDEAKSLLRKTPEQLAVLKKHNVVDSGAKGFVYYLEGIIKFIRGEVIEGHEVFQNVTSLNQNYDRNHENTEFRYCTEALVKGNIDKDKLKADLSAYGDSIIVAGSPTLKHVHLHTNTVEEVFKRLASYGVIDRPKIEDMVIQEKLKGKIGRVAILTDSIGDFPKEYLDEYDVHLLPVNIFVGENHYLDKVTIKAEDFYETIKTSEIYPNSGQPNDIQVKQKIDYLKEHYESIICIMVSSKLSGTYESVQKYGRKLQKEGYPIEVIDSKLNSAGQGLLVTRIAEMVAQGATKEEALAEIESVIPRTELYVALNTFANSLKSGRVPKVVGKIGVFFKLRPIISLDKEGKGTAFSIAVSKKALMNKIKNLVRKKNSERPIEEYVVIYAKDEKGALDFAKELEIMLGKPPKYIEEISSVTALHVGEGAVAVGFIREEAKE